MRETRLSRSSIRALAVIGAGVILFGLFNLCMRIGAALSDAQVSVAQNNALAIGPALAINPEILSQLDATTTATVAPLVPTRLSIPSIGVSAAVEQVGLKADGSMATPSNFTNVAWYSLGAKPGEPGNAVIAGHVNNALTTAGVFEHLSTLKIGDAIVVSGAQDRTLSYVVTQVQAYAAESAPTGNIFATSGPSQLVLITCDGQWDAAAHEFDQRLIVTARLVD